MSENIYKKIYNIIQQRFVYNIRYFKIYLKHTINIYAYIYINNYKRKFKIKFLLSVHPFVSVHNTIIIGHYINNAHKGKLFKIKL